MAPAQTVAASKHVITHCLKCFSYMRIPKFMKTDNGSVYVSKAVQQFCSQRNIEHKTDIPYNSQVLAIVECAKGSMET